MQSRRDILTKKGGDTVQMLETKKALENLGVTITINCDPKADLTSFDLIHLFNIDGCFSTYQQAKNAVAQEKPYVLSPIHHRQLDIEIWEDTDLYDFKRFIYPIFRSYGSRETLKSLYKAVFNWSEWPGLLRQLVVGTAASQRWVVEHAAYLLPNAFGEADAVKNDISPNFRYVVVPNGVSPTFFKANPNSFQEKYGKLPFVLCVGRVESRKNQLRIIAAVKELRKGDPFLRLVLVGAFNPHHLEYCYRVRREVAANNWIMHIPEVPYTKIPAVFAAAKSHVSASWKETSGLVNVEAALAGCGVVSPNKGYCREYLGGEAEYCDPGDVSSIAAAISRSFSHVPSEDYKKLILQDYTWDTAAKKTLGVYNDVL
jgi:glycosyltransferase involved in cell wall biosynthesis